MVKSIKVIMLLLVGLLLFSGCGDSGGSNDSNSSDVEAPNITLNGKSNITIKQGTTYTDEGATATDNVDGTVNVVKTGSVDSSKVGTYTITYTATDKAGNRATKKRVVKVVKKVVTDTTPPIITLKGNLTVTIVQGTTYTDAGATAQDNVDGTINVVKTGSVDNSKVGTYTITYTATDKAGNRATKKRVVKVVKANQNLKIVAKDNTLNDVSAPFNGLTIKVMTDTTIDTVSNETVAIYGNVRGNNTGALLKLNSNYPNGTKFMVKVYDGMTLVGSSQELTYSGSTINFNDIN